MIEDLLDLDVNKVIERERLILDNSKEVLI